MENSVIRVRFAPSPSGIMHVGNIRTALFNYLFAKKYHGQYVLRIEDTDPERIFDKDGKNIIADLAWLNITYDEGPQKGGPHMPYFQSKRSHFYQKILAQLIEQKNIYRCFCSEKTLEEKRNRQIALKKPPRYDRTCAALAESEITQHLQTKKPFIWRFNLNQDHIVEINDLARGIISFNLSHFSDFPLTRKNGSFTFIFANTVDDILMKITHVFRGEDHLSNTAYQAALYHALQHTLPIFWHMPILSNLQGKKLSKRDFGFSLNDLKTDGFLPEAIINYLGIIGGSFTHEIIDLSELIDAIDFDHLHASGSIKYDVEKLRWINGKWIDRYSPEKLLHIAWPFLINEFPQAQTLSETCALTLIKIIQPELMTLKDIGEATKFYFNAPHPSQAQDYLSTATHKTLIISILKHYIDDLTDPETYLTKIKKDARQHEIPMKQLFSALRLILTSKDHGPRLHDIIAILGASETKKRLETIFS